MFDQPTQITINMKNLRMRDLNALEKASQSGGTDWSVMVPVMARVTGLTEDQVWDFDLETMMIVQKSLNAAMTDVVKKTTEDS